jgi:hypothetical protein
MFIQKFGFKNTNLAFITVSKKTYLFLKLRPRVCFYKKIYLIH